MDFEWAPVERQKSFGVTKNNTALSELWDNARKLIRMKPNDSKILIRSPPHSGALFTTNIRPKKKTEIMNLINRIR